MASSPMTKVVIEPVAPGSPGLEQVKAIWRRNSDTLGFFTDGAFEERAQKRQILAATVEKAVAGYVAFFRNRRDEIRITHLCVDEAYRGQAIARRLIESLVARAQNASRIRLWCRRDFPAWRMWPRLGFVAFRQKPGNKESGSELTEFRRELNPTPLFAETMADEVGLKIAVDTNVFLDLVRPERPQHAESSGLQEDWLAAETQLCITDELFNDLQRNEDEAERAELLREAARWDRIVANDTDRSAAKRLVEEILGPAQSDQDHSDHGHLAYAVAGKADAFATRDEPLLAKRDEVYERTGLLVGRPAELITEYDVLINERDYQERELRGSGIVRVALKDASQFSPEPFLDSSQEEKGEAFRASVNSAIAHPATCEVRQVTDNDGQPLAFYILENCGEGTAAVVRFRLDRTIVDTRLGRSLVRFLLADIQRQSAKMGVAVYRFDDTVAANSSQVPSRIVVSCRTSGSGGSSVCLVSGPWTRCAADWPTSASGVRFPAHSPAASTPVYSQPSKLATRAGFWSWSIWSGPAKSCRGSSKPS